MKRYAAIAGVLAFALALPVSVRAGEDWFQKGLALSASKQHGEAIEAFSKAIEAQPERAEAYNNRGALRYYEKDYADAIEDYTRAIELNAASADFYNNRGATWYRLGEYDKALADYGKALKVNPKFAEAYKNRGIIFYYRGEYDDAIDAYSRAIEIAPESTELLNNRGVAWYQKGDLNRAVQDYSRALDLDSGLVDAYKNRGIAWYRKGQFDRAIDDYGKALAINPNLAEVYKNRGIAWYYKGRFEEALNDYIDALRIDPALVDAYNQLAWMLAACPEEKFRNGDKAVEMAEKAVAILESMTTLDTLAAAYAEAGRFEEAVATQERIVALAKQGGSEAIEAYRSRLEAYKQNKAWRAKPSSVSERISGEGLIRVEGGRIRSDTSLEAPILAEMERGDQMPVLGTEEDWYFVEFDADRFGWVHKSILAVVERNPVKMTGKETLVVTVDVARVREAPSLDSPIAFRLEKDAPVTVSKKEDPWYRISTRDGHRGWAHESLFKGREEETTVQPHEAVNELTVTARSGRVRQEPSLEAAVVFGLSKDDKVKALETREEWFKIVRQDGITGWAHMSLFFKSGSDLKN